jgi:glycerol-3-phosphate responsive antiterminator
MFPDLPPLLEASDGRSAWSRPDGVDAGLLLRDTNLTSLIRQAGKAHKVAVDLDTVEGLADDDAALNFLVDTLGFRIVATRHASVANRIADLGALALLRVFALDTSGLTRSLEGHPGRPGIGTILYPGLVLPRLREGVRARLPRPLVAHGLLSDPEDVAACLRLGDAVVVSRELLQAVPRTSGFGPR